MNTNAKLLHLYDALLKYAPDFEVTQVERPGLFEAMWPARSFDLPELRSKMAVLLGHLKDFLSWQEFQSQPHEKHLFLLKQLRQRGLPGAFESEQNRLKKHIAAVEMPVTKQNYIQYRLADEANSLYGQRQLRQFDASLHEKIKYLDAYYLHVRLRESCERINRGEVLNTNEEQDFFDKLLKQLDAHFFEKYPILSLYRQILSCYQQPDDIPAYHRLKALLQVNAPRFSADEARGVYRHAQNHCIRRINVGKTAFLQELLELYEQQLASELIYIQGELEHTDFKNIVAVGLRLKRFEWVSQFMENYKAKVASSYRDNVYHISKASLLYEQGQFREAIRLLQAVEFTDIFYQLSARMLLIKLYYEMDENEGLFYALDAFERLLRRNKSIARERRESHRNFISSTRRLAKLRERKPLLTPADFLLRKQKFATKLNATAKISNLAWLEEKIAGLG